MKLNFNDTVEFMHQASSAERRGAIRETSEYKEMLSSIIADKVIIGEIDPMVIISMCLHKMPLSALEQIVEKNERDFPFGWNFHTEFTTRSKLQDSIERFEEKLVELKGRLFELENNLDE